VKWSTYQSASRPVCCGNYSGEFSPDRAFVRWKSNPFYTSGGCNREWAIKTRHNDELSNAGIRVRAMQKRFQMWNKLANEAQDLQHLL